MGAYKDAGEIQRLLLGPCHIPFHPVLRRHSLPFVCTATIHTMPFLLMAILSQVGFISISGEMSQRINMNRIEVPHHRANNPRASYISRKKKPAVYERAASSTILHQTAIDSVTFMSNHSTSDFKKKKGTTAQLRCMHHKLTESGREDRSPFL